MSYFEQFKTSIQHIFISYRQQYLAHLICLHREYALKATLGSLSLMLEDLFIDLELIPRREFEVPQAKIWSYLAVEDARQLLIVGSPGSGKTTLLKHIVLTLADKKKRTLSQAPDKLPLLLCLSHHVKDILEQPTYTLAQALHVDVKRHQMATPLLPDWFEQQLQLGKCVVMLDALHEIAEIEERQSVMQWIKRQINLYQANHFIITSRPDDYAERFFSDLTVHDILPFTSQQIHRFVEQWVLSYEKRTSALHDSYLEMRVHAESEKLLQQIEQNPAVVALATTPLYLTMMAIISRPNGCLPTSLVALYANLYHFSLSTIKEGLEFQLTARQKQELLQHLAYQMMRQKQVELSLDEALLLIEGQLEHLNPKLEARGARFLQMIEQDSGLLVQQEPGKYKFAHFSFQEHLAAQYMQEKLPEDVLMQHNHSWWHQSICFYYAYHDLTSLFERCQEKPSLSLLRLASRCTQQAEEGISRQIKPLIVHKLIENMQKEVEEAEGERRKWVAELLLALRLKSMKQVDETLYATEELITHAEYQLFLDEQQAKGHTNRPDHWLQNRFAAGEANKPVVGIRPLDAVNFCKWLTERDKSGWHYRLPTSGELHKEISQPSIIGYWTKTATLHDDYELEEPPSSCLSINLLENRLCSDLERAKALSFEYNCDTAPILIDKLIPDQICIRPIDLAGAYANAHAHLIELAQDIDLALTRTLAREGLRSRQNEANAKSLNFNNDLNIIHALDRALVLEHESIINRELIENKKMNREEQEFIRWYTRFVTWLVTDVLYKTLSCKVQPSFVKTFNRRRKTDEKWEKTVQDIIWQYFKLYIDLVMLEERIEGNLPAFEGLRIVKERGGDRGTGIK